MSITGTHQRCSLRPKRVTTGAIGLFFLMLVFSSAIAHGQAAVTIPTPIPSPTQTPPPPPPTAVVPIADVPAPPPIPVGTDKTLDWTLRDAILAALQNNVDIAIERRNVRIAEFNIIAAQGVYDPILTASPSFNLTTQPNIGRFSGVSSSVNASSSNTLNLPVGLDKNIQFGGGSFSSSFNNQRVTSNSGIVSPLYSPQFSASYTQPLWRNRHIDNNRLQILVTKRSLTLTDVQFREQVVTVVAAVQQAYWNLAFAIRNVSVQSDGVALAQKQVDDNQKQVDVGTLAPLDVVTAEVTLETRREALIQAQNAVSTAQNLLKTLVVEGTQSEIWDKDIFPMDFYEQPAPTISLDEALSQGYTNRPETDQFKLQKEIDQFNIDYARNQTKPQIDLVGTYGLSGAGGTPTTTLVCPAGTTLGATSLCEPGNIAPVITTSSVNPTFIGGEGTALATLFSNQYHTVTVGVNISIPLRNRTAKAELGKALETETQTELQERKQLQTIESDVRNAYQAVQLAKQNLDAARLGRQYAETQLEGEQKKFTAGLSTTFLVLTRQNDLIQARGAEVNALTSYNNAISALQQATGTTLSTNNIEIK